jgi:divalent metal cation (Fe/Co/Zn/Cd) transporter
VIFGEDLAALLGLVFALIAVVVAVITGNPIWDAIGTLAIGVLLIVVAFFIAIEVKALLIGQSVEPVRKDEMEAFIRARPEFKRLLNLITLQLGNEVLVSMKVEMSRDLSASGVAEAINSAEVAFKAQFPEVRWSFVEPDVED